MRKRISMYPRGHFTPSICYSKNIKLNSETVQTMVELFLQTSKNEQRRAWGIFRRYPTTKNLLAFKREKALACRIRRQNGDRFNSCKVIYSQFGLAIHQNDHQARRRLVEWVQNEIAVVPDFHKLILFSDEAPFWLNGYVSKQNCRIWSEANPQVYVETPLHPEKLTVWCAL
ncbi:hypothetical protein TNCV_137451 [Trichonephila clavipes]|nr:hypothetical protein TNCV_137451 [Trichonephila clavipes]